MTFKTHVPIYTEDYDFLNAIIPRESDSYISQLRPLGSHTAILVFVMNAWAGYGCLWGGGVGGG